ncbi:protein phosphatase 2C domain-containing protein [Nocardioides sp. TRM66260-LWL]|uniref:PP2C family protein-serine/threonine phosphatase n=1 Tax=Nocardioides sp. TRM66260-LWL TaxID=2874478 RepID=UPI001CC35F0A|nr:protein phosphatase 2C domain-containing protein [Nocardioides sp. TRM66260-LWL]MBZ5735531.1 protein phosphatase 2C domain-containing protein [Nocardioides sp. TRM66260-LWL]
MYRLLYSALSDVGRVRKDNQDSGYAGPWVLAVCDGVGGAARGDIASATAISQLRRLDVPAPTPAGSRLGDTGVDLANAPSTGATDPETGTVELLGEVSGALHRAHDRIADLVDEDPALMGTSTCATLARFDGHRIALGHVGDSRAYLLRDGVLRQLTKDHTFVQSLIDEGRISEAEARVHPHRNVILRALDGQTELEPDLFVVDLAAGDRLLLCSDGACGVLEDDVIAALLGDGTPDFAAVELVRASLEAGSTDNVTCVVAEVLDDAGAQAHADELAELQPLLVGSASELRRRMPRGLLSTRRHRTPDGDGGEGTTSSAGAVGVADLPDHAITADPPDPEAVRYAPRAPERLRWLRAPLIGLVVLGVVWLIGAAAWSWSQRQYYIGEQDGVVVIFRGVNADVPGLSLSTPYERSDLPLSELCTYDADRVRATFGTSGLDEARQAIANLGTQVASARDCGGDAP